jgi:small subunit ribosomal protein S14
MAKKSSIENNKKRMRMVENKKATRLALRFEIRRPDISFEDRIAAVHRLAKVPRNSSSARIRNRCALTGRPRGYYRKFGLSRIALRELASAGMLPGVVKASW